MTTLNTKFLETIKRHALIKKGDRVLCALSGGADSVTLLMLLKNNMTVLGIDKLYAVHVNHLLRETAKRDEDFVKKLCGENGIEIFTERADVKAYAEEKKIGTEEAGREIRYGIFFKYAKMLNVDKIATAHTKDDAAETFFIRLLRGASLDGLCGIKYMREDGVIRPLLDAAKEELLGYLDEIGCGYVTDETNFKDDYHRNHIRLNLIPYIKEHYNPEIVNTAVKTAGLFRRDLDFIDKFVSDGFDECVSVKEDKIIIDISKINALDDAVSSRIINKSFKALAGDTSLSYKNINDVLSLIKSGKTGKSTALPAGITAAIDYGKLVIKRPGVKTGYSYRLRLGNTYIKEIDKTVRIREGFSADKRNYNISSEFADTLEIRTFIPGDRIYINKVGTKKIKEVFIDKKISREEREVYPIVTVSGKPVWMPGLYKDERYAQGSVINISLLKGEIV